jgi:hypothetical protein
MLKECRTCKKMKELYEFSRDPKRRDGLSTRCKDCDHQNYLEREAKQGFVVSNSRLKAKAF